NDIIGDTNRIADVLEGIRALFGKRSQKQQPVEMNKLILGVLQLSRKELREHGVETRLELASELPPVHAHKTQLEEVVFNLVHHAIEAMGTTTDRGRLLQVKTALNGHDAITVVVRDSGPGIDPQRTD